MRRLTLIFIALVMAASACFGASGTWRCANGAACVFTPGVGFHCPRSCAASITPSALPESKPKDGACSRCHSPAKARATVAASSPCAAMCGACDCRYVITSPRTPATPTSALAKAVFIAADTLAILPSYPTPSIGFTTRPLIFTTGPPDRLPTVFGLTAPSRAPPRLLSA